VQEMVIYGVSFDMVGKQPIVLLKTVDSNKFLPIWIGHPEAAAILMKLQGATTPRPMTHDLLCDMLGELDVKCTQVSVTELRDNTFFASITLQVNGRDVEIDSRPSDALAIAVRSGAPIYAAEEVIAESAIEFEHEVEGKPRFPRRTSPATAEPGRRGSLGFPGGLRQRQLSALRPSRVRVRTRARRGGRSARRTRSPPRRRPGGAGRSRSAPG
jgi:bifunctional DNase/RNase